MTTPISPEFLALQQVLVGRYSIERELDRGGMGIVLLARDVALDRLVAIKLLPPHRAASPEARNRFLQEARTAAGLSHPTRSAVTAVVTALPYPLAVTAASLAREAGCHYFDLTEDVAATRAIKRLAEGAGTAFMPQCGLAPGFIAIVAHHLSRSFDALHDIKMRVGALPAFPTNALKYNLTWSVDGLINEYCHPCEAIRDGVAIEVLPLEGLEHFSLDGTEYEAFNTSGGLGTLCETLAGRVRNLDYKSVRYPRESERHRPGPDPVPGRHAEPPERPAALHRTLAAMRARQGKLAVRGNWDVWYWHDQSLLEGTGFVWLDRRSITLRIRGQSLHLVGLAYGDAERGRRVEAMLRARDADWRLFLYHTPDLALAVPSADLYLAGHTHGGLALRYSRNTTASPRSRWHDSRGLLCKVPVLVLLAEGIEHVLLKGIEIDRSRGPVLCRGYDDGERCQHHLHESLRCSLLLLLHQAAQAGVNGYIVKPFTAITLKEKIDKIFERLQAAAG